jgi:4-amino-4-deoxychorismate lyase
MILINGEAGIAPSASDRGLQFGDGVFRTLRLFEGQPLWWADHYEKLTFDCRALAIEPPDGKQLLAEIHRLGAVSPDGVVKIIVTRGESGRGYRPEPDAAPTRILILGAPPAWPERFHSEGVRVRLCELRLAAQPRLAGVKHLNRLENVLARMEWDDPEFAEGILLDRAGRVVEGVMSNLFAVLAGRLVTPDLRRCGVAGVARERLLRAAAKRGTGVDVRDMDLQELLSAEALFLCNSLIGVWRVARLGERLWPETKHYRMLLSWLHEHEEMA